MAGMSRVASEPGSYRISNSTDYSLRVSAEDRLTALMLRIEQLEQQRPQTPKRKLLVMNGPHLRYLQIRTSRLLNRVTMSNMDY